MMRIILLFALSLFAPAAQAQIIIQGSVKNAEQNTGIENVNIMIQEKDNPAILGFTLTDKDGKYKIEYKGQKDSLIVSTSGFNIQKQSKTVARENQTLNFVVNFESIALKEVKIIPPKIRQKGDTIDYTVERFIDKNDRTIGDVMKRLPGIDVKENGQILYQNIPINKFYIEGVDLLQGRYGIATNNIEAKDVQSVQILENHQAIKLLKDIVLSEQAAINLKLKESAKGVLTSNALLGAGLSPLLWAGEITAMYFTKEKQNISTYKGNNTGNDVTAEQNMLYSSNSFYQPDDGLLGLQEPSTPSISRKRYLFNRANAFTFNNLWKPSGDYQINANVNYLNDRIDKSSFARTEYFLMRSNFFNVEETLNSRSYVNNANVNLQLNVNKEKFYLNNTLKFEGGWDNDRGTSITGDTIRQNLEKPNYGVNNAFELIKNYEKVALRITSYNSYSAQPQTLTVQPVLYGTLFDSSEDYQAMRQKAINDRFASNTSVSGGINKGNLRQDYSFGFRADLRHLNSELTLEQPYAQNFPTVKAPADSLRNDLQWNKLEWIFTPRYAYNYKGWRFNLQLPLNYTDLSITDHTTQRNESNRRFLFNPALQIQYKLSAYLDFFSSAGYSHEFGGINDEYAGYIMRTYRSLTRNEGDLYETKKQSYSFSINYKNPIHSLFGYIDISYTNTEANLLYGYDFKGILQVQRSILHPNFAEKLTAQISVNQAIDALASTVGLVGSYTTATSTQLAQGRIINSDLQSYSVTPEISTRLCSWSGFSYRFEYSENRNRINNGALKPIHTILQNGQLNFFPVKNLTVNFGYEYFKNSVIVSGSRTMSFGNIGAKYRWNKMEFLLDYTNIFNSKQYVTASYNNIYSYYYAYNLRPAEIVLRIRFKIM
ncbi:MAG: carboxypeptidase-like regulatory domain-containing protein [Candidatus Azobacteroides sp.]|nr:carboxypeptidase-like regulatory domain-containing protein [Candidatus Azobacteroides sp.]